MRLILGVLFFLCSMLICLGSYADFSQAPVSEQKSVQVTEESRTDAPSTLTR